MTLREFRELPSGTIILFNGFFNGKNFIILLNNLSSNDNNSKKAIWIHPDRATSIFYYCSNFKVMGHIDMFNKHTKLYLNLFYGVEYEA
jgi:hypothetical protein